MIRTIEKPPTDIAGYNPLLTAGDCTWDGRAAADAVDFFPSVLRHPDDSPGAKAGTPINLMPWQRDYVATLYGWKWPDGTRRYQETGFFVPRKNTKTTLFGGLTIYEQTAMKRIGAQLYSAASEREQASLVFRIAASMVRKSPHLAKMLDVIDSTRRIVCRRYGSFYRAIPADAASAHGFKPAVVTFDEVHTQKNRDLYNALSSGFGSTINRLFAAISTAGTDRKTICWDVWKRARDVRDNLNKEPRFLPLIYELKEGEDWHDEATWLRCNPGMGQSVSLEFLRTEYQKALEMPGYENVFRNLYLNEWTEQESRWFSMDRWRECGGELPDLKGRECWGGLDLSTTTDISALVLAFPMDDGSVSLLCRFWIPASTAAMRARRDGAPYLQWADRGLVTLSDTHGGMSVDYGLIRKEINDLREQYYIREIAIDRWNATQLALELEGDGFEVNPHGQGYASMSAPAKEFERLILAKLLRHGDNDALTWMAGNVATEWDAAGNIKPSKAKSNERIDGIVAAVMAVGRAAAAAEGGYWTKEDGVFI